MMQSNSSRRDFIKGAGLAGAVTLLTTACASTEKGLSRKGRAKNLIFMVVDGMGAGTLALAHHWKRLNQDSTLEWMQLYQRPDLVTALQETASANSPVTDSAAAASAWGCGQRVNNRSINYSVDGQPLTPIWTLAKRAGKATGLVTTCRVTHATPAGFAANVAHRHSEDIIAEQYQQRGIDVILGGGRSSFKSKERDLIPDFKKAGYQIVQNRSELQAASGHPKVIGLFAESHLPYRLDREHNPDHANIPGLGELFQSALDSLNQHPNGFVLQVEGGRVDHGCHANDPAATLHELLEFDQCISIATDFLKKHPDTLFILTTDHGTGGCQLNGQGDGYSDSGPALTRMNQITSSFESFQAHCVSVGKFDFDRFAQDFGIQPTPVQKETVDQDISSKGVEHVGQVLLKVFAEDIQQLTAVGWTSHNHTSECVELLALGPGSEQIPAWIENYKLFEVMCRALDMPQA